MACLACVENAKNSLFTLIHGIGLVAHFSVLYPLFKYRRSTFKWPFYNICISLGFVDILAILVLFSNRIMYPAFASNYLLPKIHGYLEVSLWYAAELHQLLIAVNRAVAVWAPAGKEGTIFTSRKLIFLLVLAWFIPFSLNAVMLSETFAYIYHGDQLRFFFNTSSSKAMTFNKIRDLIIQPGIILITLFLYLTAGLKIRWISEKVHLSTPQRRSRLDRKMFLQGLLVTLPQILCVVAYHMMVYWPIVPTGVLYFTHRLLYHLYNTCNPFIYMALNSELRTKMQEIYCYLGKRESSHEFREECGNGNAESEC